MKNFSYMLAPIEDMTSNAFRTICYKYGADLTFTEMTRIEGLVRNNKSTFSRILTRDETPTIIQLIGAKEIYFKKFLSSFEPSKGFGGFNLNLGCPYPKVIDIGHGCAMMKRIAKTKKLVGIFKDYKYKISIKIRLGLNKIDKENKVYLNLLNAVDADFFVVHSRYGSQRYNEPADFGVYEECVETGRNIIANGDITNEEQVKELKSAGVKGVMIGRAAILNPGIFNKLKGINSPSIDILKKEFEDLTIKYDEPFKYRKNIFRRIGNFNF